MCIPLFTYGFKDAAIITLKLLNIWLQICEIKHRYYFSYSVIMIYAFTNCKIFTLIRLVF